MPERSSVQLGDGEARPVIAETVVERKLPTLPCYLRLPATLIAPWGISTTTTVLVRLGEVDIGRRSLKRYDSRFWFVDLNAANLGTLVPGDRVLVHLELAGDALPDELAALIVESAAARTAWERMTQSQQRALREDVFAVRSSASRTKRAARLVTPPAEPAVRPTSLRQEPRDRAVGPGT